MSVTLCHEYLWKRPIVLSRAVSRSLCPSSSRAASLSSASVVSVLSCSAFMMCPPFGRPVRGFLRRLRNPDGLSGGHVARGRAERRDGVAGRASGSLLARSEAAGERRGVFVRDRKSV